MSYIQVVKIMWSLVHPSNSFRVPRQIKLLSEFVNQKENGDSFLIFTPTKLNFHTSRMAYMNSFVAFLGRHYHYSIAWSWSCFALFNHLGEDGRTALSFRPVLLCPCFLLHQPRITGQQISVWFWNFLKFLNFHSIHSESALQGFFKGTVFHHCKFASLQNVPLL